MNKPPIIALTGIKSIRTQSRGITDKQLATLSGLPKERVVVLESQNADLAEEPWLDEAKRLCSVLTVPLLTAIGQGLSTLDAIDTGFDLQHPLDVWLTGVRLPLRYGIRLAVLFGLDDPFDLLDIPPFYRRVWATLEAGERLGAPGVCPYCAAAIVGSAGHLPSCVPSVMLGAREAHISLIGSAPKPNKPHKRRGGSRPAPGLAVLRARMGTTQEQMAASIEINPATYYRLEKMRDPLTISLAEKIAVLYRVPVADLYSVPGPGEGV